MDSKGTLYGFSDRMTISAIFPSSRLPLSFSSKAAYALSRWPSSQRCEPAHARKDWSGSQTCVSIESDRERCRGRRNRMKCDSVSLKRYYLIEGSGTLLSKDPLRYESSSCLQPMKAHKRRALPSRSTLSAEAYFSGRTSPT